MSWRISIVVILASVQLTRAQIPQYSVDFLNSDNGLSHNTVGAMCQDQVGFMWFGTADGLNRFDGTNVECYRPRPNHEHGTTTDRAGAIAEWSGRVWVGWDRGGLSWFDMDAGRLQLLGRKDYMSSIESFHPDVRSRMWIGTTQGLYCVAQENGRFSWLNPPAHIGMELRNDYIPSISDANNVVYFATWRGVVCWNSLSDTSRRLSVSALPPNRLSSDTVSVLLRSRNDVLWIGTARGLDMLDLLSDSVSRGIVAGASVTALYEDGAGTLWIGTEQAGLLRFDPGNDSVVSVQLDSLGSKNAPRYAIRSISGDCFGTIWVGTTTAGVARLVADKIRFLRFQTVPDNSPDIRQRAVWTFEPSAATNSTSVFVGTGSTLAEVDLVSGKTLRSWKSGFAVRAIVQDASGSGNGLWVGTLGGGLVNLKPSYNGFTVEARYLANHRLDNESCIYALLQERNDVLWIGTNGAGLLSFEPSTSSVRGHPMTLNNETVPWVLCICEEKPGVFLLGTWKQGLIRFNTELNTYEGVHFAQPSDVVSHRLTILAIAHDKRNKNIFWIGTNGNGLLKFDVSTDVATSYREEDGLANNAVYGVVQDEDGMLWITTNYGLSRFSPETSEFTTFHIEDGLQGNAFNLGALRASGGGVLVGGDNGFNVFFPGNKVNSVEPRIVLTSVHSFNTQLYGMQRRGQSSGITLTPDQRFLRFSFVGLHYKNPSKNRYSYMMEGFDTTWIYTSTGRAEYNSLPSGEYVFKIKAANSDGVWNREPHTIPVFVKPPFWLRSWFWAVVVGVLFLLAFVIQRHRNAVAIRVERTTQENQERLRSKLAADFHDELGARAAKISIATDLMLAEAAPSDSQLSRQLLQVSAHANQLIKSVREMTWQFDPARDTLMDLAIYLKDFSDELFDMTNIAFHLEGLSSECELVKLNMEWRQELSRIFKEGMTNILKHAGNAKNVRLSFRMEGRILRVELADDGKGFDPESVPLGHGLKNMAERAIKLGAKIDISSSVSCGTKIHFEGKLP